MKSEKKIAYCTFTSAGPAIHPGPISDPPAPSSGSARLQMKWLGEPRMCAMKSSIVVHVVRGQSLNTDHCRPLQRSEVRPSESSVVIPKILPVD